MFHFQPKAILAQYIIIFYIHDICHFDIYLSIIYNIFIYSCAIYIFNEI